MAISPLLQRSSDASWAGAGAQPSGRMRTRLTSCSLRPPALQKFPNNAPNPAKPLISLARDLIVYDKEMRGIACRETSILENCYVDSMKRTGWMDDVASSD